MSKKDEMIKCLKDADDEIERDRLVMPGSKSRRWHMFLNVMRKYIKHFRPFVVRGIRGRGALH